MARVLFLAALGLACAAAAPCATPYQAALDPARCCARTAPASFNTTFLTTAGKFTLAIDRAAAPLGVDRYYNLIHCAYLQNSSSFPSDNGAGFFRVVPGFVVQFGIAGIPALSAAWNEPPIKDDPVVLSNVAGTIAFATAGPNTRTTQLFINLGDNARLDADGFAPFGRVTDAAGLAVVRAINSAAGEQPDQDKIYAQGDAYLRANFPQLDYIITTTE
jgi:peptidyl-prolyl cis-trans isomerase A (cyclophilin A)